VTKRRKRLLAGLSVLALLGVLALPDVHWRLIGWARGEPFYYHGRPAIFWFRRIQQYGHGVPGMQIPRRAVLCAALRPPDTGKTVGGPCGRLRSVRGPRMPFIDPDPDAVPVLIALLGDDEPTVRGFAVVALFSIYPSGGSGWGGQASYPDTSAIGHGYHRSSGHDRRPSDYHR